MTTFEVLCVAGIVVLVGWAVRNSRRQARLRAERAKFIAGYVFPAGLRFKLDQAFPAFSTEQTSMVLEGLRAWFQLVAANPGTKLGMPSRAVDSAWHEFILLTKNYADFCDKAFGKFLHHVPHDGDAKAEQDGLARTYGNGAGLLAGGAALGLVGGVGVAMLTGRDLFGLDQRLGMPGGTSYDATDFAELEKRYQKMQSSGDSSSSSGGDSSCSGSGDCSDGGGGGGCGGGGCGS